MSNLSCAAPDVLERLDSFNMKLSQFVDLLAIILAFFASYFAIKIVINQSFFELSTKILLLQNLFYTNLYQISYGIEAIGMLYRGFFMLSEPCSILQSETSCAPYFKVLMIGTSGMIFGQTGLLIERAFATFATTYKTKKSVYIGVCISLIVLVCSTSSGFIILWDDPLEGWTIGCFAVSKSVVPRFNLFSILSTVLTLFNLIVSIFIQRYNKRFEFETRFKVGARFQKQELIESTGAICFLALSQFLWMFMYSFGILILRIIREDILPSTFYFWIAWCYTMPFIALMFPVLLIYRIRKTRARRTEKMKGITTEKQTQDDHIKQINAMWT